MHSTKQPRIAILIPNPPGNAFWSWLQQNWIDSFAAAAPNAQVDFFDPVEEKRYPSPSLYDLLVVSGGKTDASSSETWILEVLEYIRTTVATYPQTKLLGVCWGHQAIARALGGSVRPVPDGPVAGVLPVRLTGEGRKFFAFAAPHGSYRAPEFHVREVARPALGFLPLAERNECFISKSNTILTFQAHPEISNDAARAGLINDDGTYTAGRTPAQVGKAVETCMMAQDGFALLRRVVEWINE